MLHFRVGKLCGISVITTSKVCSHLENLALHWESMKNEVTEVFLAWTNYRGVKSWDKYAHTTSCEQDSQPLEWDEIHPCLLHFGSQFLENRHWNLQGDVSKAEHLHLTNDESAAPALFLVSILPTLSSSWSVKINSLLICQLTIQTNFRAHFSDLDRRVSEWWSDRGVMAKFLSSVNCHIPESDKQCGWLSAVVLIGQESQNNSQLK